MLGSKRSITTWAFSELYGVVEIGIEKSLQLAEDSC